MFFFFKYHNQKWDMWTDASHASTGDFGFLVRYLQSWLWMVFFFFFFFFEKVVVDQSNFLKSPTVKLKSRMLDLRLETFVCWRAQNKKTLPEMLLKALNEPQKHHRVQCSVIKWRKSTVWATVKQQWSYQYRRGPRKIVTKKPLTQTFRIPQ